MCLEVHLTPNFFVSRRKSLLFQTTLVKKIYLGTCFGSQPRVCTRLGPNLVCYASRGSDFPTERRQREGGKVRLEYERWVCSCEFVFLVILKDLSA